MNICLIGPPIVAEFIDIAESGARQAKELAAQPQLGMLVLASALEAAGYQAGIINLNRDFYDYLASPASAHEDFSNWAGRLISSHKADVYGFSSICSTYPLSLRMAALVKSLRPNSTIVFGGPQASVVDVETLTTFPFVDFVLRGEADQSFPSLLHQLAGGAKFSSVPGLTYRQGKRVMRNPGAPRVGNMDDLPLPAFHLVDNVRELPYLALELGRGCPFACKFCSTNDFFRRDFRLKSPARMVSEMQQIAREYGVRTFELVHDMFTVDKKRVAAFCHELLRSDEGFLWSCSARTDCVDDSLLELMAKAGCTGIFFGVETGSVRMQRIIDKHLDIEKSRDMVAAVERHGMSSTVSLISGFPDEEQADLRDTLDFYMLAASTPHADPQLNLLAPLSGTPIHQKYKDELVLHDLCSEVSHQGRFQNVADHLMIEIHPDIFPNFYLIPTAHLDRAFLMELREFMLMANFRMRWLLVALHQTAGGVFDVFSEWRLRREEIQPGLDSSDLRQYYRLSQFRHDFVEFVESNLSSCSNETVVALLAYEKAIANAAAHDSPAMQDMDVLPEGSELQWTDLPTRQPTLRVFDSEWDLQRLIRGLQNREEPVSDAKRHTWYATRQVAGEALRIVEIGALSASILKLCIGERTLEQVRELFQMTYSAKPGLSVDTVFISLLEVLVKRGFLTICRARYADFPNMPLPLENMAMAASAV